MSKTPDALGAQYAKVSRETTTRALAALSGVILSASLPAPLRLHLLSVEEDLALGVNYAAKLQMHLAGTSSLPAVTAEAGGYTAEELAQLAAKGFKPGPVNYVGVTNAAEARARFEAGTKGQRVNASGFSEAELAVLTRLGVNLGAQVDFTGCTNAKDALARVEASRK